MDDSASVPPDPVVDEAAVDDAVAGDPSRPAPSARRRVLLGVGLAVLTGVTAWLFGNLPWVLSGFSWTTTEAAPIGSSSEGLAGVRLAVPLVAAFLPSLIAFTAIGAVTAGLLPLVLTTRDGERVPAIVVTLASLTLTTVVVTLSARSTIEDHAANAFAGDPRVLRGLVVVVLLTAAAGAALGTLASVQVGFLPLAVAVAAGQLPVWVRGFLVDHQVGVDAVRTVTTVSNWLVLAVLAVAFALSVRRTAAWAALWPVAIALLWTAAPFGTMTVYLAGQLRPSAGLPDSLPDILQGGLDVFRAAYWEVPQARWPWVTALLLAVAWTLAERWVRGRRRQARA